jgi:F-type H+-transporting ATPase subunit gamma
MANLKEIRRRIGSVKGTQKITRAMRMVAAAKLRKAQGITENFRSYADLMSSVLAEVASEASPKDHPLLERREAKRSLVLVISSDRGLCGGFNSNLNRLVAEHVAAADPEPELTIIGKKSEAYFKRRTAVIHHTYSNIYDEPGFDAATRVARDLAASFASGEVDRIDLAFNEMLSLASQKPIVKQLLPIAPPTQIEDKEDVLGPVGFIFEPRRKELLGRLLPRYVEVEVYRALLESIAAEHAARMIAMEAATNNAQDMIEHLTLIYNRARQGAITNELLDIVGGAEALND